MNTMPDPLQFGRRELNRAAWHNPLISIVVTHFNYSQEVEDALLSILDQTHERWECVVVDDGSDEKHRHRLQAIVERIGCDQIRLIRHAENLGQIAAFYTGLDATHGEFVCLLDPDDRYSKTFLAEMLKAHLDPVLFTPLACCDQLLLTGGAVISSTNTGQKMRFMDKSRGVAELPQEALDRLLYIPARTQGWHWTSTSAMMFRRAALDLIRPHRRLAYKGSADSYLAQGLHLLGGTLFLTTPLVYRGVHAANAYLCQGIFATVQNKRNGNYGEERTRECRADVVAAIEANGGHHHLKKAETKTARNRWRRSLRKRWLRLTGRGRA